MLILYTRGELIAYGEALKNNFLYSQGLLIQPGNAIELALSHAKTLYLSGKNQFLMLLSLAASIGIFLQASKTTNDREARLGKAGLAGALCAIALTTMTGLWVGHLQLLYPTQCLALVLVVQGWHPQIRWQKAVQIPSLLLLTAFLSGTLDLLPTYWLTPPQIADRLDRLQHQSVEEAALR
jgi:uncharacterized membrane protein YczE